MQRVARKLWLYVAVPANFKKSTTSTLIAWGLGLALPFQHLVGYSLGALDCRQPSGADDPSRHNTLLDTTWESWNKPQWIFWCLANPQVKGKAQLFNLSVSASTKCNHN